MDTDTIKLGQDRDWLAVVNTVETLDSIICWKILGYLNNYWLLKKGSPPWS
jgi:hypothetical protein